jgi:hypothetical protein
MNRFLFRYFVLCQKSKWQIAGKFAKDYGQTGLYLRAGQENVEDDERSGKPAQINICDAIRRFLEKNPQSSFRDMSKAWLTPKTTILRLLADLGLKFYQARWIPHRLSEQQKADRITFSQDMLQTMKDLGPKQQKYLMTGDDS